MVLSIIIVNWNALDYLRECIESIYRYTSGMTFEIIVVDNASAKGDIDTMHSAFPEVVLIKSPRNLGFAGANNLGVRKSKGSYLLFLNPDTKLVGPAINHMMDCMRLQPNAGIVGCRHVSPDLTVQTTSIQKFPTISNQVLNIEYLRLRWPACPLWNIAPLYRENPLPVEVDVIPGACMLLRRELFERIGLFSEEYFMYAEDIDLNYKIARLGFKNYYVSDAVIIHYGGVSSSQKTINQWATMMKYRAMSLYYDKHYGRWYAALYRTVMGACALGRLMTIWPAIAFVSTLRSTQALHSASQKWTAVLRWALGLADRSLNVSIHS